MLFQVFALIFIGIIIDFLFQKIKTPALIGWLMFGVLISPNTYNLFAGELLTVSQEFKSLALIVILLRAGLEIDLNSLKKIGIRAILMSFVPCIFEMSFVAVAAYNFLKLNLLESLMLGSVLAAVSPAIIVPAMIKTIKEKRGIKKGIPTLVLAGSSCDDAVAIVLCTSFVAMYIGGNINFAKELASIPISIVTGCIIGIIIAFVLYHAFKKYNPRATKRTLTLIFIASALLQVENNISMIPFSAIIAIMTIGIFILNENEKYASELSSKFGKIWIFAQILLFVLVGMQVNVKIAISAGFVGIVIIFIGLLGRSIGVLFCLAKSNFNKKEKLFVVISYLPKATVQAAIGGLPLNAMVENSMPTHSGQIILAIAIMSILITAPLGSFLINFSRDKLLAE